MLDFLWKCEARILLVTEHRGEWQSLSTHQFWAPLPHSKLSNDNYKDLLCTVAAQTDHNNGVEHQDDRTASVQLAWQQIAHNAIAYCLLLIKL